MRFIQVIFFSLFPFILLAQPKTEIQEFSGFVKSIEPGFAFAFERLILDIKGESESFLFYPYYGTLIKNSIKIGDEITLRAAVNLKYQMVRKEAKIANRKLPVIYFLHDRITELKISDEWIALLEQPNENEKAEYQIFLNRKVLEDYLRDGFKTALIFDNGLVAYNLLYAKELDRMKLLKPGSIVSFGGYRMKVKVGYEYPIAGVKEVCQFVPLTELSGKIHSFLFKQNYVCIGAKFHCADGRSVSVSFPSDHAERIRAFIKPNQNLKFYYHDYKVEGQLNEPELHAIIQGSDTIYIKQFGFYGGADVKHEHTETRVEGKITKVNTSEKGNIISFIVNSDVFIEVDAMMAQQLWYLFKRGTEITIEGKERIKKEGEIYSKNYRIIIPQKVIINGKEFSTYNP